MINITDNTKMHKKLFFKGLIVPLGMGSILNGIFKDGKLLPYRVAIKRALFHIMKLFKERQIDR
jgi:hypothetical protein